ncbi:MAG: FHA domain-containing protein [Planctomycetota bacterium]
MQIKSGTTLGDLGELCLAVGEASLLRQLASDAYLVVYPWERGGPGGPFDTCVIGEDEQTDPANATILDHEDQPTDRRSRAVRETIKAHAAAVSLSAQDAFLMPLEKTQRNPFTQLITLGRARNNDLIVNSPSVSKVHAWFLNGGPTGWFLQDNGSTNGTTHNDEQTPARTNVALRFGDTIGFGGVQAVFADSEGVLELAKRRW